MIVCLVVINIEYSRIKNELITIYYTVYPRPLNSGLYMKQKESYKKDNFALSMDNFKGSKN